ncbi:MAG: gamma-glutamyltransferase [Halothece sp.]
MSKKTKGIIAAGHEKTAEAGIEMFRLGGNAFDAAIASMLASFVVEPGMTSAAGGGFLLAHTADKRNLLFDFFTQTPRVKKPQNEINFYPIDVNFGGAIQTFHTGLGSIAVPGNLAGVFEVHKHLGTLPLSVIAEPAIAYAKNGVTLEKFPAFCFELLGPIFSASPEGEKIFFPEKRTPQIGETFFQRELGNTLAYLVEEGIEEFYSGSIAAQFIKDCQENGGYLTLEDLEQYQVIIRKPLKTSYRGHSFLTNPPPSSGGTLIAFALKLLETISLSKIEFGSSFHLELLAKVMELTNRARADGYDARIYEDNVAEKFLASSHLAIYQTSLNQSINKWGSTTHISVMDTDGNAASVTTSNGEGSCYVIPGTGILVNNMLGEADLNPLGFHTWPENQRISSMMSPTLILSNGKPEIVLGSGGANRIRTAILQVISNIIDFKMSVEEAVSAPRIHWENSLLNSEPPLFSDGIENLTLPKATELIKWKELSLFFGGVHAVRMTPEGHLEGIGDRRREGVTKQES